MKGIDVAIKAMGLARGRFGLDVGLEVVGGGYKGRWAGLVEDAGLGSAVSFPGLLPMGEAVRSWMDSLDLYIQPSFQEGLPRSLVEAMSRACPVLGSTAGGIPELLEADCLHKPGNATKLAEDIWRVDRDKKWLLNSARRSFEVAREYSQPQLDLVRRDFIDSFLASAGWSVGVRTWGSGMQ